jgi:hypothetical protein
MYVHLKFQKGTNSLPKTLHVYSLKPEKNSKNIKTPKEVSWVPVPLSMFPV